VLEVGEVLRCEWQSTVDTDIALEVAIRCWRRSTSRPSIGGNDNPFLRLPKHPPSQNVGWLVKRLCGQEIDFPQLWRIGPRHSSNCNLVADLDEIAMCQNYATSKVWT
jgi:hypothetical protein